MGRTCNFMLLFQITAATYVSFMYVFHLKLELSQELLLVLQLVRLLIVVSFVELDLVLLLGLCSLQRYWRLHVLTGAWNVLDHGAHHQWLVLMPCSLLVSLGFLWGCSHVYDLLPAKWGFHDFYTEVIKHGLETQVLIMVCCQNLGAVNSLFFFFQYLFFT